MHKGFLTLCCTVLMSACIAQKSPSKQPTIRIALVNSHIETKEFTAIQQLLQKHKEWSFTSIKIEKITSDKSLKGFTHIWYHRTDTIAFDKAESEAGQFIKKFVTAGGNLFLSMESVALLNVWEIEKKDFQFRQDTLLDEGFGRPAGFHAFKSHPLFSGLNGGVYTSKQKADHLVRKHGFFDATIPKGGRVAGIDWTYIKFSESNKLLLEYKIGKGIIIAAGAYLYYGADNYNKEHLERFTANVFSYTSGQIKNEAKEYWNFQPQTIRESAFTTASVMPVQATTWILPTPTLRLNQPRATKDFYDLVGRRILWMGALNGGADEIWMHPYMALRDLRLGVTVTGTDSVSWLRNISAAVEITPEYIVRIYKIRNTTLKEIYTVSFDEPNGVAHIEVQGNDVKELTVTYASNLRYMWPYSPETTGSIQYAYCPSLNGHLISGQQRRLNTLVTYSTPPLHQKIWTEDSQHQVKVAAGFLIRDKSAINIYITGSNRNPGDAIRLFARNAPKMNRLFERSGQYYSDLLKNHLYFTTPDSLFNNGYKWAMAKTDQFLQTTPGIGTALMAGFGTTARGWNGNQKISGRPGYAWYFGRDGQWSAMAIDAYGDFAMVKEALETFIRFQDVNGKIYHELTSSGAAHYDASDATPLFIVLASHYLRYSGDNAYILKRWPQIKKALDFCYSTDTDMDGLIENTNVGHGWIEGGELFGTHTEFYLAGTWAAALDAAAYLATHIGVKESGQYAEDAAKVKKIIDRDFWNEKESFFYNGKMQDGSYMPDATVLAAVPVYFDAVTDTLKAAKVSSRFNSNYFSTAWGIRMIEDSSKKYSASSYHAGMIWPLFGGWAALSEYKTGNYRSGFQHIMNNLLQYRNWSPGSMEETLNGDVYKPNGVCSHQAWSETMILQPAIEGMLGFKPDAMANRIELAPYFPWLWKFCRVHNIRMNNTLLQLEMKRQPGHTSFLIHANRSVKLDFSPVFPLNTIIRSITINGKKKIARAGIKPEGLSLPLSFFTQKGNNVIEVATDGGIGLLPVTGTPEPGDSSICLQVNEERVNGKNYTVSVSGRPGKIYELQLYCPNGIKSITGATIIKVEQDMIKLKLQLNPNGNKYSNRRIVVELN
ncbi:MAG: amylo-alpha-1,6-glucosidase [Ferruginibacter sp.]